MIILLSHFMAAHTQYARFLQLMHIKVWWSNILFALVVAPPIKRCFFPNHNQCFLALLQNFQRFKRFQFNAKPYLSIYLTILFHGHWRRRLLIYSAFISCNFEQMITYWYSVVVVVFTISYILLKRSNKSRALNFLCCDHCFISKTVYTLNFIHLLRCCCVETDLSGKYPWNFLY